MKIIIDVPEEQYNIIKSDLYNTFSAEMKIWGLGAIRNGTPLPKGHGELVDIRPLMRGLYEEKCVGELTYTTSDVYKMIDEECPTIIEADMESEG